MAIIKKYVHLHNVLRLADEVFKPLDGVLKLENVVLWLQPVVE